MEAVFGVLGPWGATRWRGLCSRGLLTVDQVLTTLAVDLLVEECPNNKTPTEPDILQRWLKIDGLVFYLVKCVTVKAVDLTTDRR